MRRITRIRSTPATEIRTVVAPDAESAIKEAIRVYDIREPWKQEPGGSAYRLTMNTPT